MRLQASLIFSGCCCLHLSPTDFNSLTSPQSVTATSLILSWDPKKRKWTTTWCHLKVRAVSRIYGQQLYYNQLPEEITPKTISSTFGPLARIAGPIEQPEIKATQCQIYKCQRYASKLFVGFDCMGMGETDFNSVWSKTLMTNQPLNAYYSYSAHT